MSDPKPKPRLPRVPHWLVYLIIVAVVASWVPLAMIAKSRAVKSPKRRVHLFLDMDVQARYNPQDTHPLYQDGRAMRTPVKGTVARGELRDDDHFHRGYETDGNGEPVMVEQDGGKTLKYYDSFPDDVTVNADLLKRGRKQFNIYCAVCHGHAGYGDGMVHRRVNQMNQAAMTAGVQNPQDQPTPGWVQPRNLHEQRIRNLPLGQLYNTIARGVNTMPGYSEQLPPADRWAVVAYIKALQMSQHYPADQLPPDLKQKLPEKPQPQPDDSGSGGGGGSQSQAAAEESGDASGSNGSGSTTSG